MDFVLASASPRRLELLAQIGLKPLAVMPADIDETPNPKEKPHDYVKRIACQKAAFVDTTHPVLAADTCVVISGKILGKPQTPDAARTMLAHLSGRRHSVLTCIAVSHQGKLRSKTIRTRLRMRRLSETEIEAYIQSNEWQGKAGGYGIQGLAAAFIPWINGSYSAVVGLPLCETLTLLRCFIRS